MKKTVLVALILSVTALAFAFKNGFQDKVTMSMTFEVKNYMTWKRNHDQGEIKRTKEGVKTVGIYIATDNQNMVTVMAECMNAEAARQYLEKPETKTDMNKGGVIGDPETRFYTKVF